jgi:hypothetical protein
MTYAANVQAIPDTTRFIPASRHPRSFIHGLQTAIVTGPDGEEIYPDQYGRVKVQFHWDRKGVRDEKTTCWIRVSQGWAGGQFGTMAIPRIGHEVIVTFLEGDPDRPLITGRVFNSASPVPYPLPEHKTRTVFKSMTTPGIEGEPRGFNELRVEDKKGQEEIYAHAEKDVNVYVKNDWKEHVLNDQHRTIDNFSYSLVKGEDQQTVHLDRKVELLSDDHLTVRGSRHCRIGKKWLVAAGKESHVAAGRKIVVEAGSELTIKAGGSFIKIDPSGLYIGGAKVRINSGGSPGTGSGASPLLPSDSERTEKGTVPQRIVEVAEQKYRSGTKRYAKATRNEILGEDQWKCNQFVYEALKEAGAESPLIPNRCARWDLPLCEDKYHMPSAEIWADETWDLGNWKGVSPEMAGPGTVVSTGKHVGIMVEEGYVISAGKVGINKQLLSGFNEYNANLTFRKFHSQFPL